MAWRLVLFACATTALHLEGFQPTIIGDGQFSISRLPKSRKQGSIRSTDLQITPNVIQLRRREAVSLSSIYVQSMRGISRAKDGTTPLHSVEGGQVFTTDVLVGGQAFSVVVDTGSSDPWLATTDFTCFDPIDDSQLNSSKCEFGPTYNASQSTTFRPVANQNFNISYADGEYLNGVMATEAFRMGGIDVPNQQFGVINTAAWLGDGISSGLVGFAYRTLTSAHSGSSPSTDVKGKPQLYNPLFVNMYQEQGVPPLFSLAIDRDPSVGGIMGLGGIPNVRHSPSFTTVSIQPVGVNSSSGESEYEFYAIDVNGYAISANNGTQFGASDSTNPTNTPLVGRGTDTIVDSGTSLCYVSDSIAQSVADAFSPPATYRADSQAYFVDCNATAPVFGVGIGQKIFYVNAVDMITEVQENVCVMGVQPNLGGLSILGGTWLKNVLAVFDIGAEQMRFAARQYYTLT